MKYTETHLSFCDHLEYNKAEKWCWENWWKYLVEIMIFFLLYLTVLITITTLTGSQKKCFFFYFLQYYTNGFLNKLFIIPKQVFYYSKSYNTIILLSGRIYAPRFESQVHHIKPVWTHHFFQSSHPFYAKGKSRS